MMQFRLAKEIQTVAHDLIVNYHPHLVNARIEFLFTDKISKSHGKVVWAKTQKVSGVSAFLSNMKWAQTYSEKMEDDSLAYNEPFFVIMAPYEIWCKLDATQRKALIDHELTHIGVDDNDNLTLRGHDIEVFSDVVRRYGLWHGELQVFADKLKQLDLFANAEAAD